MANSFARKPADSRSSTQATLYPNDRDDLGAIRALLSAIATHHSIEVPKEAIPHRVSTGDASVHPKGSIYDEQKTIEYQKRQLPTESTFRSPMWGAFPFKPLPTLCVTTREPSPGRLSSVLSWHIDVPRDPGNRKVDYDEFGFDENGYACYLPKPPKYDGGQPEPQRGLRRTSMSYIPPLEKEEHIFKSNIDQDLKPAWAGQRFGKEWNIGMGGKYDEEMLPIIVLQLCGNTELCDASGPTGKLDGNNPAALRRWLAANFLAQFMDEWGPDRYFWGSSKDRWATSTAFNESRLEDLVFQYHMRVFTSQTRAGPPGRGLTRTSGTLTVPNDPQNLDICEIRYSIGLRTTWELDLPIFSLVTMADSDKFTALKDLGHLWDTSLWNDTFNIRPSIRGTGVAAFAFRIHSLLPGWSAQWSQLLKEIDIVLRADLPNILKPDTRRGIMVDGSDLRLSEFYPVVLHILRIAADWIQESMDDLCQIVNDMERLYFSSNTGRSATFLPLEPEAQDAAIEIFKQNWESVLSHQNRLGKALLVRIASQRKKVESLKDGMFNATSVSEATKSTSLNHYILVFTVVTIFYLPLSFVATLFTLGLFGDWSNPQQEKWFYLAIAVVAGGTYLFSGLLIWFITREPGWLQGLRSALPKPPEILVSTKI